MLRNLLAIGAVVLTLRSTPEISSVSPPAPVPNSHGQSLTISGKDFLPGLTLDVITPGGQTQSLAGDVIALRNSSSFDVSILLDTAGTYSMKVTNTDGGMSAPFSLQVRAAAAPAPAIAIDRITPDLPVKNSAPQTLHGEGRNFSSGLTATVNGPAGNEVASPVIDKVTATTFDLTELLDQAGDYAISVRNAAGAASNTAHIMVR